jgi:hypothetical protein
MDFINRICDAFDPGQERREELDDVFKQLRAINEIRNSLLHYGSATFSDKGRVTSNVRTAHVPPASADPTATARADPDCVDNSHPGSPPR